MPPASVLMPEAERKHLSALVPEQIEDGAFHGELVICMDNFVRIPSQQVAWFISQHGVVRWAGIDPAMLCTDHHDQVHGVVRDGSGEGLTAPQGGFGFFSFGDVLKLEHEATGMVLCIPQA